MAKEDFGPKKVADVTIGNLNKATKYLLSLLDPANQNIFDMLIYPQDLVSNFSASLTSAVSAGTAVLDSAIAKLYLQSINFGLNKFEYENLIFTKVMKTVHRPDTVTFKFIDNQYGFVRLYLNKWQNEIFNSETNKFKNNQSASCKNAIIIPSTKIGLPCPVWFKLEGLKLESIGDFTFEQGNSEFMYIEVICKVDIVRFMSVLNFIG